MTHSAGIASPDYARMAAAISWLTRHYGRQPTLEEAARAVGLSPTHFQRVFARWAGLSPKKFVGYLTLEHARAALAQGSVFDAALDAGLSGASRLHDLTLGLEAMTPGELKAGGAGLTISWGAADSPFGRAVILTTARGLCGLAFAEPGGEAAAFEDLRGRWPRATFVRDAAAAAALAEHIFSGGTGALPLLLAGTPWQVKVWEALLRIPEGRVTTYGAIAREVCTARAARAVGAAVGANPIAWLIPCHRVLRSVAANGAVHPGGYRWGPDRKRAMLALEAAVRD